MSDKVTNNQQRRRVNDSTSKVAADNKILVRKDRKPPTVDASQNGRPPAGRDRGGRSGRRRDSDERDRDTRRKDRPLSAKAESYRPTVLKPEHSKLEKDRAKETEDKCARGIPAISSPSGQHIIDFTTTPSTSIERTDRSGPVKVHFGVIKGMPYEFTSNSSVSVTPKDMRKYGRKLFADNSQLSILVRRILQEDDRERDRRLNAFRHLKDFIDKPENARDVYKQTDNLLLVLHEVLLERTLKDIKREVSHCISVLGWQLRYEGRRFFNWIFGKIEAATTDESRLFLLHAVLQTLSLDNTHYYKMQIPVVMTNLQTALENAEAPVVLMSVMSIIHYVAEEYPDIFINNFKDTVDILVGWHIDTTQNAAVIKYCSDSLISFHQFWLSDMEFSTTLLGQFLEDMNAYAEDLMQGSDSGSMSGSGDKSNHDDDIPPPDICKAKILALLKVFTTVVKSLGDEFTPLHGPPITFNYLAKIFNDIVECVEVVQREAEDETTIALAANACLSVICDCVQQQLGKFEHNVVPYVLGQLDILLEDELPKTQHLLSPLELLFKAIFYMRASFPSNLAMSLLGPQSKLRQLRFQPNKEVLAVVLRVYQSLLCVKDIPMLETVYSLLLAELEIAYNTLLASAHSTVTVQLATDNPFTDSSLSILEAKTIAMFDLNAFMEIASAKSSIIGMWALSPSLFDLLSKHLIPTHMPLAEHFPAVHYTLLNALCTHAQSHAHFISSAFGIGSTSVKIPAITTSSQKTSGHFPTILNVMAAVLPHPKVSCDCRKLCLRWLSEILKLPQLRDYSTLDEHSSFTLVTEALLPLAHNPDQDICLAVCSLMQQVLKTAKPSMGFLIGCVEICKTRLVDSNVRVSKAYTALLESIPADILLRNELSPLTLAKRLSYQKLSTSSGSELDPQGIQVVRLARCGHINRPLGTFHPHDFKKVMGYILLGEEPSNPDWLERMYHSCQKSETRGMTRGSDISLPRYIDGNKALQWFWATWEAAQMCVLLKLRTPLGKPQETFRAIEAALWEYCRDTKTVDSKCQAHGPTCQAFSPEYVKAQIRPVLLLQFLEHLEKLMYNAYEGCALAMPGAPKTVKTFFRTNRVTCQDWLRTIRPIAALAANNVGQHAVAIRHGLEMINDLVNRGTTCTQTPQFDDAIQKVVSSCVQLHCPQPILGLMSWCQETVDRTLYWVAACVPAAESKYENCAAETIHAIKKYLQLDEIPNYSLPPRPKGIINLKDSPPDSPRNKGHSDGVQTRLLTRNTEQHNNNVYSHHVTEYLLNQVTQCYISVSDWSSAVTWQQAAVEVRSHVPNQKHIVLTHDMNAIKALGKFEDRDFAEVAEHLDLIPGLALDGLNPDDVPVMNDDVPDLEAVLDRGLFEFVRALTHFHLSGCSQALMSVSRDNATFIHRELSVVSRILQTAHKMGLCGVQTAWLDWPAYPNQGHTILMQSTKALINTINGFNEESLIALSADLKLDPSLHDTKVIGRATQVMKYQYYLHTQLADDNKGDIRNHLSNLQLATAQLARKQGNLSFAQRLLRDQIDLLTPDKNGTSYVDHGLEIHSCREKSTQPLLTALRTFKKSGERSMKAFHLDRECAKLSLAMGNTTDAWTTMAGCIVDYTTHVNASLNSTVHKQDVNIMSTYTARSLLNLVKWFQADYRSAIAHVRQARASDATEKSSMANSLGVLLDMEHDGVMQRLGLAAYSGDESAEASDATEKSSMANSLGVLLDMEHDGVMQRLGLAAYSGDESAEVVGSSPAISENDAACGRLLHLAVMQSPVLAKAWSTLASWCYRWGRKAVDIASSDGGVQLTEEEKSEVLSTLPLGITNSETDCILEILSQAHCSASTIQEEDIIEQLQSAYHDGRETTRMQLLAGCPSLQSVSPRVVDQLLEVWNQVCRRIFSHYRLAARGYFTFLKLAGGKFSDNRGVSSNISASTFKPVVVKNSVQETAENQATQEDGNITATLRLLRLLVKYAGELRDVLEDGLANTPTAPWKSIIPQLFSRLNHPEAYVRQSISDLMCRVAVDSPHLIVYQAVVGSPTTGDKKTKDVMQQSMLSKLLTSPSKEEEGRAAEAGQSVGQPSENPQDIEKSMEEEERNRSMSMLEDCLQAIVSTLSKHNPKLVCQVEVLVQELRRITVLWEELWLGTLTQLHVDVTRRLHQLEEEVKRVKNNESLSAEEKELIIAEKHNAIMKPIVYALEQVHSITSENAETPNEKSFQDAFQDTIEKALSALRTPKDPSHPQTSWYLFKQLQGTLQQRATKRSTFMLQISDISPRLGSLKDTIIPLPGLVCQPNQVVSIDSFAESVNILPTKTKPKKLVFIGQDGKRYTYLFKGLEDLHLDERIMQFLAIVNTMFGKNKRQDASLYHACHYSVTPLGPRSGLIQWVDGATALFGLYKRWQQREALATVTAKGGSNTVQPQVSRPSEVFYSKMTPALKEAGLSDQTPRKEWPMPVIKDVLKELMADTPKDLLAKELWCSSGSASEWWYITQSYSRSTAVMSIIGYIIGLGDRHLDNVLVNFLTGDVVHIDYNVCFEKGKNLRVPERVPFRMTQNIEAALGVTGVEGTFRQTAEEVLKIMRKGRETLLTLLEAFVYDPLVDWTTGNEGGFASAFYGGGQMNPVVADGGEKKREMEKEITRSLFSSRVAEMKAPWFKNRDAILDEISKLEDILKSYLATIKKGLALEETSNQYIKQIEILQAALGDKNHTLHTLGERYSECSKLQTTQTSVLQAIQDKLRELEHWHAQHTVAIETARGQHLTAVSKEMELPLDLGAGAYLPVVNFLKTAGQTQVISQCEHVETELCNLMHQRRSMLKGCVDVLQAYCTLAQQFPANFAEMNRAYIWQQWIQELICDFTAAKCDDIIDRYQDHFTSPDPNKIQQVVSIEMKQQALAADANARLHKAIETLKQEQTERPHAKALAQQYEAQINQYIKEKGDSGSVTLIAVIMNVMSSFCKRSLIMEGAVASAGDLLVDFTTRNGNWFLEELCSMINNLDNFFKFIYLCSFPAAFDTAPVFAAVDCFRSLKSVYAQLQELHSQFKSVLTPLVVKSIQSEDPSVSLMLKAFNDLCQNTELPLQKVAYQIEQDLATVTLGMQTELTSSEPVQLLRSRFSSLIEPTINTTDPSNPTALPLSAGQNLLSACNAVFKQLLGPVLEFVSHMEGLPVPQEWRRVDVIQDAKGLKASVLNANTQELLMNMFFVKQLQALNEFYLLCRCYGAASKGDQDECNRLNTLLTGQQGSPEISALLFTESQLVQPIKKFLAHYIRKQILGIATQVICLCACTFAHQLGLDTVAVINVIDIGANSKFSIDILIKKAVEVSIQKGLVRSNLYSVLNNITSSYDTSWRAADQARQLNVSLGIAKDVAHRAQSQLVRYQWLQEDILQQAGHQRQNAHFQNPPRSSVMSDLRKRVQLLSSLEAAINAVQERSISLHASISQRLKWASGANPSLNTVLKKFDEAVTDRNKIYAIETKHSAEVSALSNAILHFEALRTRTTEAMNAESNFLSLLNRTLECCEAMEASTASISEVEEGFVRLKRPTPDQPINHKWIRQVLDLLKKRVKERDKKTEEHELLVHCGRDALHSQVDTVKNTLGTHHKLMSEVKGLLKTIAREEEEPNADGVEGSGEVKTFMMAYKSFSEEFTNMLKVLLVGSSEEETDKVLELANMMPKIQDQTEHTKRLYDHLVSLADPLLSKLNEEEDIPPSTVAAGRKESGADIANSETSSKDGTVSKTGSPTRPPPGFARQLEGTPSATPPTTTAKQFGSAIKPPQAVRDPRTGKMLQVRNTHAINVWRRVKGKLDGRDPDSAKRLTVAEQIDFVIKEATSMENLATLYEGWTAWV